jgi:hypothetical protein
MATLGPNQKHNLRTKVYGSNLDFQTAHAYHQLALNAQLALRKNPHSQALQLQMASARYQYELYNERYQRAGRPGSPLDPNDGASAIIAKTLNDWGLGPELTSLANKLIKQGLGQDAIMLQLESSDAYKKRFAANATRKKNGLPELSPSDYIATEAALKDTMRQYGLPKGFYDSNSDLTNMIANDVSPTELDSRLQVAKSVWLDSADAGTRQMYKKYYGLSDGDVIAGILDPKTALPQLQARADIASLGGAALDQGVNISLATAQELHGKVTADQAQQGFGEIAGDTPVDQAIAKRFGSTVSQNDEINAVLLNKKASQQKISSLRNAETGLFNGRAGATQQSLSSAGGGSF